VKEKTRPDIVAEYCKRYFILEQCRLCIGNKKKKALGTCPANGRYCLRMIQDIADGWAAGDVEFVRSVIHSLATMGLG
jgi:hypothetical protein